jgi:uncharacterized membrane protein
MRLALADTARLHRLIASAALVAALWGVRAELPAGFTLHFLGAGLSMLASLAAHRLLGAGVELFVALGLMLGFGEAFLTGALVTLFVVYRHDWVSTFDDSRYLARR